MGLFLPWLIIMPARAAPADTRTLCFFSLNDAAEFELTRAFLDKTNRPGDRPIRTIEFHNPDQDADPESSFRKMVASHPACDGLVISGHHTGSFGGKRSKGVLNISVLEELSCDVDHAAFFKQIKGVWLQGCRTLGVGQLGLENDAGEELQADYHMQRVGAELTQDGLEQGFAELSFEFSATLDQDNPLATRYLRVFPAANIFGWTKSSPGEKAGSERSLLYHMAHMARISKGIAPFNPMTEQSTALQATMSESLWELLGGGNSNSSLARQAWFSHGQVKQRGLGFDNPDLNAYLPLLYSSQEKLLAAKALGCEVRNAADVDALTEPLVRMLSDPDYVAYNLNVIWETFRRYSREAPAQSAALRMQLVDSIPLMNLLRDKLITTETGLLMKIEYYSFYKELTGNTLTAVESHMLDSVRYFLLARDLAGSEYDIRDFRESLLSSVADHQLAEESFYLDLIRSPQARGDTLYTLTWSFVKTSPEGAEQIISEMIDHPYMDSGTLRGSALWVLTHGTREEFDLPRRIVAHPQVDAATLATMASVIGNHDIPDSEELVAEIVSHPEADGLTLRRLSLAIRKQGIEMDRHVVDGILGHPSVDKWAVQNVASAISRSDTLGDADAFWKIVRHDKVDADALSSVAIALGNQRFDEQAVLLQSIVKHPRADERTLRYADRAAARNRPPEQEETFF